MADKVILDAELMGASIPTAWQHMGRGQSMVAWTVRATGTPSGEYKVWGANQADKSDAVELPDALLDSGAPTDPTGSALDQGIAFRCYYQYAGISYVRSGGTGALTVIGSEKRDV